MSQAKSNRSKMLLLVAVFILPVLFAKIALETDFFNRGATNNGSLLDPVLDFSSMSPQDKKWRIMYVLPEQCMATCENAIYSLNQVWVALGREMDRTEALIVTTDTSDQEKLSSLNQQTNIKLHAVTQQSINQVFKDASTDGIFVVDTLDNIILRYPLQQEQQQAIQHSREILADMKKLLKLSRIG